MSKFLVIYVTMDPSTQIAISLLTRFSSFVNGTIDVVQIKSLKKSDVDGCDVLISIRTQNYYESKVIRYAKKHGKLFCLFIDDDFFSIPDYKIRRFLQYRSISRSVQMADVILCTNESLGRKIEERSQNGKFVKIDTVVTEDEISDNNFSENSDTVKIVYYVSDGSLDRYKSIVEPLMTSVYAKYGDKVQWHFIGIKPEIDKELKHVVFLYDRMSMEQFKYTLSNSGFTIGIAPLLDNAFDRGKYINKFIEYTCAGIPAIYSDVEPYASFIRNGYSGFIVGNTTNEWLTCIESYMDPSLRKTVVGNAKNILLEQMSYETVFKKMLGIYGALENYKAPDCHDSFWDRLSWNTVRIRSNFVMIFDPVFRMWGRLRCEGIKSLLSYSFQKISRKKRS